MHTFINEKIKYIFLYPPRKATSVVQRKKKLLYINPNIKRNNQGYIENYIIFSYRYDSNFSKYIRIYMYLLEPSVTDRMWYKVKF